MTLSCTNITRAPYISRANLLSFSPIKTLQYITQYLPPTSQTTYRRYINLSIITFDLFLNYLNMSTTNIDRDIVEKKRYQYSDRGTK